MTTDLTPLWTNSDQPQRLAELAAHAASPQVRGHVLTLIDYLSEIVTAAESLRAQAVARARQEGESWQVIAAQIGVTKQAAHKRYNETPAEAPTDTTPMWTYVKGRGWLTQDDLHPDG